MAVSRVQVTSTSIPMRLRTAPALVTALLSVVVGPAAVAAWGQPASPSSCGSGTVLTAARVTIDAPAANATPSGSNVSVRGSASTALGSLSRVEANLGGMTKTDTVDSPGPSISFNFSFDTTTLDPGQTTLSVVACGAGGISGLARGETSIPVTVQAAPSAATTTTVRTTATTVTRSGGATAAPAAAGRSSSTVAPTSTTTLGPGGSQTTLVSAPPATEAPGLVSRAEPVRPRGSEAPVVLTETPARHSPRSPLWVGVVVGVSGGLGLLFSALSWRRRAHHPQIAEPVDPDLVEVG